MSGDIDSLLTEIEAETKHILKVRDALIKACEEAYEEILMLAGPNDMADEGYPMKRTDEALELIRNALKLAGGKAKP